MSTHQPSAAWRAGVAGVLTLWLAAAVALSGCRPSSGSAGEADGAHKATPPAAPTAPTAPNAPATAPATAQTPAPVAPARPRTGQEPAVVFRPNGKPAVTVAAEVVRTPRTIRRGMMYRRHLAADSGMLFLMEEERVHTFWMRNTLIPLDMIFITSDMVVAGVVADARPLTDESRYVPTPSLYVLEVNGGWAAAHGITAGIPVEFQRVGERPAAGTAGGP